jgi:uncharacterized MAPEG superfamily protein
MSIPAGLSPELFWLAAATILTAVLWVPYILDRIAERGLWGALSNPPAAAAPRAAWANRMIAAHRNAVENLAVFAPLVLVAVLAHRTGAVTAQAAMIYVFARLAHAVVYTAGIPVLRTLAFAAGWIACLRIALVIFGA